MSDGRVNNNQGDESKAIQQLSLKAYSACMVCPNCGKIGFSRSEQKCNMLNILFCCCFPNCWYCYQVHSHKDLNCYDAEHKCTSCNTTVANYTAC